jgi:hypothetical protein
MWTGAIIVTICTGWLCKAIYGEEFRYDFKGKFQTEEQCRGEGDLIARFAAIKEPHRIECKREGA